MAPFLQVSDSIKGRSSIRVFFACYAAA